jgi:hypothetical protein
MTMSSVLSARSGSRSIEEKKFYFLQTRTMRKPNGKLLFSLFARISMLNFAVFVGCMFSVNWLIVFRPTRYGRNWCGRDSTSLERLCRQAQAQSHSNNRDFFRFLFHPIFLFLFVFPPSSSRFLILRL